MQDLNRVLEHLKRKAKGNIFRIVLIAATLIICAFMFLGEKSKGGDLKITTKKNVSAESPDGESDSKKGSSSDNGKADAGTGTESKDVSGSDSNSNSSDSDTATNPDTLCVYVCGAVVNEGVYELPPDSIVSDALEMAGGYSDEALKGYVNLAEKVNDGERIYIPNKIEIDDLNIIIDQDTATSSQSPTDDLVNINTADATTLQTLPGIGESKAAEIIAYRDEHGAFGSVDDIKNVSGIGEGTFSRISSRIKVE